MSVIGTGNSNAVWQVHFDKIFNNKARVSINYLIDEYVLDQDIQKNKNHGNAYSSRFSYNILNKPHKFFTLYIQHIYVGTPTFRHNVGFNNFVQKNQPIGWFIGSDSEEISLGCIYMNKKNLFIFLKYGQFLLGEESIKRRVFDPYENYNKGNFPSGEVIKDFSFQSTVDYKINEFILFTLKVTYHTYESSKFSTGIKIFLDH